MPEIPGSSKRDAATALAAVQENKEPHLRRQACSTLLRSKEGSECAFAWARELRNDFVSWDHRPQTSTASTTNRARPGRPTSFGYLRSFRCRAACKATPSAMVRRGSPSAWRVLTMVVSTASCTPPKRGSPPATTSSLRPSPAIGSATSRSRSRTFVATRPPASRQVRATTLSNGHPRLPKTPTRAQAARWWPRESSGRPPAVMRGQEKREVQAA